ncbi:hypothetical protein GCM10009759_28920 [Kitasatospora saccharophila]|uniref:Uncharacterized protein n=1 Tax=Kitasatospora saccharophila TaxID=407973 RepID=A0ABP5ICT8_9ACTN
MGRQPARPRRRPRLLGLHLAANARGTLLLVLARIERGRALALFALGYPLVELVPAVISWWGHGHGHGPWPAVVRHGIPALYLLAGALLSGLAIRRPRPWITLTPAGEHALREQVAQLKRLIRQIEAADGT